MKTIDHTYKKNITCPYCGCEERDSWEYSDDDGIAQCGDCGEDFNYERIVTVEYSTSKIQCAEHSYKIRLDYPLHLSNQTSDFTTGKLRWLPIPESEYKWYRCEECEACQHERMVEISQDEYNLLKTKPF